MLFRSYEEVCTDKTGFAETVRVVYNPEVLPLSPMLLADTVGKILIAPLEIPVGVVMSVVGGPFFIFLLKKSEGLHES